MDKAIFQAMSFNKSLSILVYKKKTSPTLHAGSLQPSAGMQTCISSRERRTPHLVSLRKWRGGDPDGYFDDLGARTEKRMNELSVTN